MASIRKRSNRWEVRVRRIGYPTQSKTFTLKADAQIWARECELSVEQGHLSSKAPSLCLSLEEAANRFLKEVSIHHKGREAEQYRLTHLVARLGKTKSLSAVSPEDVAKMRNMRLERVSSGTVRRELTLLSSIFEIAKTEWGAKGLINPVAAIKRPKDGPARDRRLTPLESKTLLEGAQKTTNPELFNAITLALETAMRQGEILKLQWPDIDFDRRQIIVRDTKNGANRMIVISDALLPHLNEIKQSSNYLFSIKASGLQHSFKRLVQKLRIENLTFHDLRHEAISRLFERGLSVPEVQLMSGHKTLDQLMRYSHAHIESVKNKLSSNGGHYYG